MPGEETLKYVAIVPAYNPGPAVTRVVSKVCGSVDYVIIFDDGSNTENKAFLEECARLKNVCPITHKDNRGKGYALMDGIREAIKCGPDYILTIDSDGQHDPKEIAKFKQFISSSDERPDLVIGARRAVRKMPFRSKVGNIFTAKLFNSIFNRSLADTQSGFRASVSGFCKRCRLQCPSGQIRNRDVLNAGQFTSR
jgi:glycosyltransferase involved in cell wall biosynthesis